MRTESDEAGNEYQRPPATERMAIRSWMYPSLVIGVGRSMEASVRSSRAVTRIDFISVSSAARSRSPAGALRFAAMASRAGRTAWSRHEHAQVARVEPSVLQHLDRAARL